MAEDIYFGAKTATGWASESCIWPVLSFVFDETCKDTLKCLFQILAA